MLDVATALNALPPVFDLRQAATSGLSARVVERAVRRHLVRRLGRALFVAEAVWRESSPRDRHLLVTAAATRLRPWAVVSHHSAVCQFGLPLPLRMPSWVALTTDRSSTTGPPAGLTRLEPGLLPAHHVQELNGLRVTSVARTVIDCLRETWFESWSFIRLWQLGVDLPESQVSVHDHRGRFLGRVDGLWRDDATVAEADGLGKYLGQFDPNGPSAEAAARTVVAEKAREDRIRDCGLEVVRWDLADLLRDPASVAKLVANARKRSDPRRFTGQLTPPATPPAAAKPPFQALEAC